MRDRVAAAIVGALADDAALAALRDLVQTGSWAPDEVALTIRRLEAGVTAAEACRREVPSTVPPLDRALGEAAVLFRVGLYFEVHEVLEAIWLELADPERSAVQGLIQIAVALHHLAHANPRGAVSLFAAGREKLAPHRPTFMGVEVSALLADLVGWEAAAAGGAWPTDPSVPPLVVSFSSARARPPCA
ncbi:MAG: DUF309 domain-containing protein [Candidatus Binatia bacterium]